MQPKRTDRRTLRTRKGLRKALIDLIGEKEYDAITVEEITARADLGRATFYLHYKDKDDLLLDYFSEIIADRVQQFAQVPLSMLRVHPAVFEQAEIADAIPIRPLLSVFQHAAENAALYRLVLRGGGTEKIAVQLQRSVTQAINDLLQAKLREDGMELALRTSLEVLAHTFVGAFLSCLTWWLEQNMPLPPAEIARQFRLLIFPGLRVALGITDYA